MRSASSAASRRAETALAYAACRIVIRHKIVRKNPLGQSLPLVHSERRSAKIKHSDLYVDSNYQRRMGEKNQKVWVVRFDLLSSRSDVSGFIADDVKPLT